MTMVNRLPNSPVQGALYAILIGDAPLMALLPGGVNDQPPEGAMKPYVRLGDHLSTPDNDHTAFGREITETLHVWTKSRSNGPGQAIANRIVELLDHQVSTLSAALAADGHECVSIRHEFDQALEDPDPQVRHHVVRFRICTSQIAP